jgi:hypothetical protein
MREREGWWRERDGRERERKRDGEADAPRDAPVDRREAIWCRVRLEAARCRHGLQLLQREVAGADLLERERDGEMVERW